MPSFADKLTGTRKRWRMRVTVICLILAAAAVCAGVWLLPAMRRNAASMKLPPAVKVAADELMLKEPEAYTVSWFKEGNVRAGLAVDIFNYGVKKLIGAYAAAMGGVDAIIFTAGVGENSASQRMAIASGLEFMGVVMDEDANKVRGEERVISAPDSKVTVWVIPTNEELMIAQDTAALTK